MQPVITDCATVFMFDGELEDPAYFEPTSYYCVDY